MIVLQAGGWDIGTFLKNAATTLEFWFQLFTMIVGLVMLVVAIVKIAKGLMSDRGGDVEWLKVIALGLVGGALAGIGGWTLFKNIMGGGTKTIQDLGTGNTQVGNFINFLPYILKFK